MSQPTAPYSGTGYVEAEDRAYHRVQGIPFRKRVKPPIPPTGKHPRCAYRWLPTISVRFRTLRGQLCASLATGDFATEDDTP